VLDDFGERERKEMTGKKKKKNTSVGYNNNNSNVIWYIQTEIYISQM
jgi:hypothetical protein